MCSTPRLFTVCVTCKSSRCPSLTLLLGLFSLLRPLPVPLFSHPHQSVSLAQITLKSRCCGLANIHCIACPPMYHEERSTPHARCVATCVLRVGGRLARQAVSPLEICFTFIGRTTNSETHITYNITHNITYNSEHHTQQPTTPNSYLLYFTCCAHTVANSDPRTTSTVHGTQHTSSHYHPSLQLHSLTQHAHQTWYATPHIAPCHALHNTLRHPPTSPTRKGS